MRKRKKGLAGRKSGPDAFRIIAWTTLDIRRYAETNGRENIISVQLNWTEGGKDFLGKGALLNAIVKVLDAEVCNSYCTTYTYN